MYQSKLSFNEMNRNRCEEEWTRDCNKKEDYMYAKLPRSSTCTTFYNSDVSSRKTSKSLQSVRLSIDDLIHRAKNQTENSTKSIPLIEKDNVGKRRVQSSSTVFVKGMNSYFDTYYDRMHGKPSFNPCDRMHKKSFLDPFEDIDNFSTSLDERKTSVDISSKSSKRQSLNKENENKNDKTEKQTMLISNGVSQQGSMQADRTSLETARVKFAVRLEYMTLSNKLKVDVKRLGTFSNEAGGAKSKNLVAKISILPSKVQRQQVKVRNGEKSASNKYSRYFRGISTMDLTHAHIGVGIYKKIGFFRRLRVIHEWKISMKDVDLSKPVTAWREVDCYI